MLRQSMTHRWIALAFGVSSLALLGCSDPEPPTPQEGWSVVAEDLPGALLSVYAPTADNVWAVGSDPGDGVSGAYRDGRWIVTETDLCHCEFLRHGWGAENEAESDG